MSRSKWKIVYLNNYLISLLNKLSDNKKIRLTVWSRDSFICSKFLDFKVRIHKGNSFIPVTISEKMIGHKFGEFAYSRQKNIHPDKYIKKKLIKKK